jgi:hypothetical protein
MQKALYGLLRSALLFYCKLVGNLEGKGFVLNPYDLCIANKTINGKQMTICWHVDNLKVSHEDPGEVTAFGEWLSGTYGVTIATHRGKVHGYLGIILNYSCKVKVMVNMTEYIKSIILDFLEEITTIQATRQPIISLRFRTPAILDHYRRSRLRHSVTQWANFCS